MMQTRQAAVVTGAGSGIGRATAMALAQRGHAIAVVDLNQHAATQVADEIVAAGGTACAMVADIACDAPRILAETIGALGRVDMLINNAGVFYNADFLTTPFDVWRKAVDVMYFGAVQCSQVVAQYMVAHGIRGRIVNTSSINAFLGAPLSSHYNTAKGAIDQLTRCLAVELAPHGILVNGVAPGFVETPMAVVDGVNEHTTDDFQQFYVQRRKIPLARPAMPEEIATVMVFLAEGSATYLTGQTIVVDGGLSVTF